MSDQEQHSYSEREDDAALEHRRDELSQDAQLGERAVAAVAQQGPIEPIREGHPPGLYLLFMTEMWERFSYYGMRALLTLYMIAEVSGTGQDGVGGGLGFNREQAGHVYGWYTSLVYLLPVFGGMLADKLIGTHRSMLIGGVIIAMGHAALAMIDLAGHDTTAGKLVFFSGLGLIILGTGFFKPCVSVMVGQLYRDGDPRRDSGFTIFYMGINLGAFFSAIVCGALASAFGWWAGFGAAGVGMVAGLIVYSLGRPKLLKGIGLPPEDTEGALTVIAKILASIAVLGAVVGGYIFAKNAGFGGYYLAAGFVAGIAGIIWFVSIQQAGEKGPTAALFIIAFFVVFFWYAFEQAGSSMNVFAQQRTNRSYAQSDDDGVIKSGKLGDKWLGMKTTTFARLHPDLEGAAIVRITQRDGDVFEVAMGPATTIAQFASKVSTLSNGEVAMAEKPTNDGVVLRDKSTGGSLVVSDGRGSLTSLLGVETVDDDGAVQSSPLVAAQALDTVMGAITVDGQALTASFDNGRAVVEIYARTGDVHRISLTADSTLAKFASDVNRFSAGNVALALVGDRLTLTDAADDGEHAFAAVDLRGSVLLALGLATGEADGVVESAAPVAGWAGMNTPISDLGNKKEENSRGGEGEAPSSPEAANNPFNIGKAIVRVKQRSGREFAVDVEPETTIAQFAQQLNVNSEGAMTLAEDDKGEGVVLTDTSQGAALIMKDERGLALGSLRLISGKEFPAAWYQSLNPLYILVFAPLFAVMWGFLRRRKLEPHTAIKMGYGLVLLGLGFVFMVIAGRFSDHGHFIPPGATETPDGAVQLSLVAPYWLAFAYLFHTWGELSLSPIGLSLTTKLAPRRWVSFMMGVWFLAPSIAQLVGGYTFAYIGPIEKGEAFDPILGGQGDFFLVFVITSVAAGVVMLAMSPILKRLMKGHE